MGSATMSMCFEERGSREKEQEGKEGRRVEVWLKVQSENGRRDFGPHLEISLMSDNEAAPVVNKNKRHRKEKRTSVGILGGSAGN